MKSIPKNKAARTGKASKKAIPLPTLQVCPSTLSVGFDTFSRVALKRLFNGKKVNPILPYDAPNAHAASEAFFDRSRQFISISGVQEKYAVLLDKNKLRLINENERGTYILKPIPSFGKKRDQMPANEHLTMQLARQLYGIETAENTLVFFKDGTPAYLTKRFDFNTDGSKLAQDDFASLAQRTPQTHGEQYKYSGNYLELFELMQHYLTTYKLDAPKLLKLLIFNYLFSNGDAHFKNFSILETADGDYRLSPAYDLLNSSIHIEDADFALEHGLLPPKFARGKIATQFGILASKAGISKKIFDATMALLLSKSTEVERMIARSFLNESTKRSYLQAYQARLKQLLKT